MSSSSSDGSRTRLSPDKPPLLRRGHLQELHSNGVQSSPASLSGSLTDIPVLLVNGEPQPDLHTQSPGPEIDLMQTILEPSSKPVSPHSESHVSYCSSHSCWQLLYCKQFDTTVTFIWLLRFQNPFLWQPALNEVCHGYFKVLVPSTYQQARR